MYNLLLADDEVIIVRGLRKLISWDSFGIEITGEAISGDEAERMIINDQPHIAILDIQMPVRTGLQILQTIHTKKINTKVIFLSGYEEFAYVKEAIRYGARAFLTKPVKKDELISVLQETIGLIKNSASAEEALAKVTRFEQNPFIKLSESQEIQYSTKALLYMAEHYAENITLESMARVVHMNPSYFSTVFKKNTGMNFKDCLTKIRMEKALSLLCNNDLRTYEIAERVGFVDARYFSELFKKIYGKTPVEYRREKML